MTSLAHLIPTNKFISNPKSNFTIALEKIEQLSPLKVSSFDYFGDFATLLTTSIVEYSVIGAAIMIVLWRSIDENTENAAARANSGERQVEKCNKRKHKVRIDCRLFILQ